MNQQVKTAKFTDEDYEWEQQCFGNPYQIKNFNKFAFPDPDYFSKEQNRKVHSENTLLVVDTEKFMNSLTSEEQLEYKQFMKEFAEMWCPNETVENYSLCYVVGCNIKYFHIGIYSHTNNLPWEEKDIWLDKHMPNWLPKVKGYTKTLKDYCKTF